MLLDSIKKGTLAAAAVAALAVSTTAAAWTAPDFPRVGGVQYGSPMNFNDPNYQNNLAKLDIMILADWPGMAPGGVPMNTNIANIKAKNPNALVFVYIDINSLHRDYMVSGTPFGPYRQAVDANNWWLYSRTSTTTNMKTNAAASASLLVNAGFGMANDYALNVTPFAPKDANGNTQMQWAARWFTTNLLNAQPAVDGIFVDNVFIRPYINGDWNRDGVVDSQTDPKVGSWFRQGYASYYALARQLSPNKYQMGNVGDWGDPTSTLTEYQNMVNGGLMEAYIGKSWSIETQYGWAVTLQRYHRTMAQMMSPKLGIFNQWGNPTDYQAARYGITTCLMDDGYYAFTSTAAGYSGVVWFDELDQKLGTAQAQPTQAWQKGVWRRDFDNGIALVNPKGNGTQTVTLEGPFIKIKGNQDPTTNSGQTVTTVTLKDRDGIILLRQKQVVRPATPSAFSVEH